MTRGGFMPRKPWSVVLAALGLLPVACESRDSMPAGWKSHPLGKGQVTVAAPGDYRESTEPEETLVLTPPNDPGLTLRFNLNYAEGKDVPDDVGIRFVRAQAKKKNLPVTEKGEKVFLTETSSGDEAGVKVETRFWQIGFQNAVVVMSATVIAAKNDDAAVKECLEKIVPGVIDSMRKR